MKIAISTLRNSDFKGITDITLPVMKEYCDRHGYTLSAYFTYLQSPDIIWKRLERIKPLMEEGHDFAVHMDADVLITNMTVRIEDIATEKGEDVATSEADQIINDGVFIWGEGEWPERLNTDGVKARYSSPQEAINEEYGVQMPLRHVPSRTMNSVLNAEYGLEKSANEWQPGDFVLHLPGIGIPRRIEILKQYLPLIQR